MKHKAESIFRRVYRTSPTLLKNKKIAELVKVYEDLEKLIKSLKLRGEKHLASDHSLTQIDLRKLLRQLSESKIKLERKIGNKLLLEKQQFRKKIKNISEQLVRKEA